MIISKTSFVIQKAFLIIKDFPICYTDFLCKLTIMLYCILTLKISGDIIVSKLTVCVLTFWGVK